MIAKSAPPRPPPPAAKKASAPKPPSEGERRSVGRTGQPSRASVSLEEQLQAKALRKVAKEDVRDSSSAEASSFNAAFETTESVAEYQKYMQAFNIERWLTALGDATFDTEIVPISMEEARTFITLYKGDASEAEQAAARVAVEAMASRLQVAMELLLESGSPGCFVKTSSRSAKDHAEPASIRKLYLETLGQLQASDENAQLVALSYASMTLLCMRDATRVLDIFIHSERCWHDMELALAQAADWEESLVARRWIPLEPDMEFRCFVSNGRLTAVSQYRHLVCFPRLLALRSSIAEGLKAFVNTTLQPRLAGIFPRDQYVVDVAVELENADARNIMTETADGVNLKRWWCIEVNPFFETTDGCLFSWNRERAILEGTIEAVEPEVRLREKSAKGAMSLVYGKWRDALAELPAVAAS